MAVLKNRYINVPQLPEKLPTKCFIWPYKQSEERSANIKDLSGNIIDVEDATPEDLKMLCMSLLI